MESPLTVPWMLAPSVPAPERESSLDCTSAQVDCVPLVSEYNHEPDTSLLAEDELLGSLSDAALDGSQERHPAIATGLTILDASDTPAEFLYI